MKGKDFFSRRKNKSDIKMMAKHFPCAVSSGRLFDMSNYVLFTNNYDTRNWKGLLRSSFVFHCNRPSHNVQHVTFKVME